MFEASAEVVGVGNGKGDGDDVAGLGTEPLDASYGYRSLYVEAAENIALSLCDAQRAEKAEVVGPPISVAAKVADVEVGNHKEGAAGWKTGFGGCAQTTVVKDQVELVEKPSGGLGFEPRGFVGVADLKSYFADSLTDAGTSLAAAKKANLRSLVEVTGKFEKHWDLDVVEVAR